MHNKIGVAILALILPASAFAQAVPGTAWTDFPVKDSTNACADFHAYACARWEQMHPIGDRGAIAPASLMIDRNNVLLGQLYETAAQGGAERDAVTQKIGDYYASCMDERGIEQRGVATLQPELDRILSIRTKRDLAAAVAHVHLITGNLTVNSGAASALFNFGSYPDPTNPSHVVFAIAPSGLGMPSRDYYLDDTERARGLREAYRRTMENLFRFAGESERNASAHAAMVAALETKLARSERSDTEPPENPRIMTLRELRALAPHFDWKNYFQRLGVPVSAQFIVLSSGGVRSIDAAFASEPLETWKAYLEWNLLNASAQFLPARFSEARFDFYGRALFGRKQMSGASRRCIDSINRDLGEIAARAFIERTITPETKEGAVRLIEALRRAFAEEIDQLEWMSSQTRTYAKKKLAAMVARVASPEHWPDDSALVIVRGDALGNAYRTSAYEVRRDLARIGRPRDRSRWEISPADFGAYNERVDNTITVSAPGLHPPFFDPNADDATNFGAIGSVIAHEMTHGFDDQGRLRDGEGALHDWWTPEDARRFEERAKCLRDEYSAFVAVDDVHVNGDRTISENIADNGGLRIALRALHDVLRAKGTENQRIDGLTPDQRFFLSYAHIWCGGSSPAVLREKAETDQHAPASLRVNGVVSNMPEFASAFGCKAGDAMVRATPCDLW